VIPTLYEPGQAPHKYLRLYLRAASGQELTNGFVNPLVKEATREANQIGPAASPAPNIGLTRLALGGNPKPGEQKQDKRFRVIL
jgi:hypothetical protein